MLPDQAARPAPALAVARPGTVTSHPAQIAETSMRTLFALLLTVVAWPAFAQGPAPGKLLVRFETTMGAFTVALDTERAPLSSANIARYAADGFYDGTIFHRVVPGFAVQGGGYTVDGTEKPARDPVPNESGNGLTNRRGTVALARRADPHSAAAEFYVNLADNINLDPRPDRWGFAVVGTVVQGMDVIDRIATVRTGARGPFPQETPLEPVVIKRAEVLGGAK
jgi:cyclophilin family peptidyl-prolyl cis-trans isomerase